MPSDAAPTWTSNVDPVLRALIQQLNDGDVEKLRISFLVGGSWLTGEAVGARAWFESLGTYLEERAPTSNFGVAIRAMGANLYPSDAERAAAGEEDVEPPPLRFAHLVNGKLTTNRGMTPAEGGHVRVRLDIVEGWLIGTLNLPT
jgi:hypothetical protein